ncbi:MAG: hypothetical protein H6Q60_7 [Oscillospiraceae bacterium]|nr:hypothetical protein [Oscillospiraceae bacterium]
MKIQINQNWTEIYREYDQKIEQVIPLAVNNLIKRGNPAKNLIWHQYDRENMVEIEFKDMPVGLERFISEEIDLVDVLDFAFEYYLPICRNEYIKRLFKQSLDRDTVEKYIKHMGFSIKRGFRDMEKGRYYFYADCPCCGTENFFFSFDQTKKDVYVGCYNPLCDYANQRGVNFIGFLQQHFKKTYIQAVEYLEDIVDIINKKESELYLDQVAGSDEYIITGSKEDALTVRSLSKKLNIISVYGHMITETQLNEVSRIVPHAAKIMLAFDSDIKKEQIEMEADKLIKRGFMNIYICDMPTECKNFSDIKIPLLFSMVLSLSKRYNEVENADYVE